MSCDDSSITKLKIRAMEVIEIEDISNLEPFINLRALLIDIMPLPNYLKIGSKI